MDILKKLGFEEREISAYLALLKSGKLTATSLSERTGIDRSTIYRILNGLIKKGFVNSFVRNNVKYFGACDPEVLVKYANEIKSEMEQKFRELSNLKISEKTKVKVEVYEGTEGAKSVLKDILKTQKDYFVFGYDCQFKKVFPETYLEQYIRQLKERKITERMLVIEGTKIPEEYKKQTILKFLPRNMIGPSTLLIYGNKIAHIVWIEPYFVIVIENKEISDSMKTYFDLLWKIAKS
jgi:sugar-specific transcriptional regulator TrmB